MKIYIWSTSLRGNVDPRKRHDAKYKGITMSKYLCCQYISFYQRVADITFSVRLYLHNPGANNNWPKILFHMSITSVLGGWRCEYSDGGFYSREIKLQESSKIINDLTNEGEPRFKFYLNLLRTARFTAATNKRSCKYRGGACIGSNRIDLFRGTVTWHRNGEGILCWFGTVAGKFCYYNQPVLNAHKYQLIIQIIKVRSHPVIATINFNLKYHQFSSSRSTLCKFTVLYLIWNIMNECTRWCPSIHCSFLSAKRSPGDWFGFSKCSFFY